MSDDPLIGHQLANFRIERVIGRGGMAQVYYGQDVKLRRPVAIKVIDARYRDNPTYAQRFVQEARTVATWRHENIVQIYYADDQDGLYYFAMEHIDGQDLATLLAQYAADGELMPHADVLRIGRAIASALDYAHRRGVIHRDVKPSNVLIARDDRVVLSDFGLALDVQQGSLGEAFGTPHYIAPEQARRSTDAIPQSDLYSLGIILYEMLTGVVPFDDPSPTSVAIQHLTLPPPPPRTVNPNLNAETETALLKALNKQPAQRYQTGGELIDALESALHASTPAIVQLAALPPLPARMRTPAVRSSAPSRKLSRMTVAERVALPPERSAPLPATSYPSTPARRAGFVARPTQPPPTSRVALFALAGGAALFAIMVIALGLGATLLVSQQGKQATPQLTETLVAIGPIATTGAPTRTPEATQAEVASTTPSLATEAPTIAPTAVPAVIAVPTVKYPNGKRFMVYYDENSLYLLNLSDSVISIYSVAFERLNTSEVPLNRFDGWRWAEFYPNSKPDWCMAIEILSSPSYLRPSECTKGYLSTRTPTRDDPVVFWTTQEGSRQFRVLWKGSGPEEEVARCEIGAGTCEVFLP